MDKIKWAPWVTTAVMVFVLAALSLFVLAQFTMAVMAMGMSGIGCGMY